jgi:hypothetical protein
MQNVAGATAELFSAPVDNFYIFIILNTLNFLAIKEEIECAKYL